MNPSILFVDDEANVLDGLKRMLYPMRAQWEMSFCRGGHQALKLLETKPFDIMVTDLLMPEMDGGKLLEEVHAKFPETIRIVLSGYSGRPLALKAARHAHQFLPKPTSAESLRQAIDRILSLRAILTNPKVQALIARVDTLPALPEIHRKIMLELQKPNPSINLVGDLIAQDLGLSASIIKLVNSAFFCLRTRVSSPFHAVNLLGLEVLSALVLSIKLFSSFDSSQYPGFNLENLWRHSLNTGLLAKAIAQSEGLSPSEQDDLYIAGILHDVGKLVLLTHGQGIYAEVLMRCREENTAVWQIEQRILDTSHAELGAYLLSMWGLDQEIVQCIHAHHTLANYAGEHNLKVAIVHAANCFDHELTVINASYSQHPLDLATLERFGFSDRLPGWAATCENALREINAHEQEDPDC